jgi:hypothetical protein
MGGERLPVLAVILDDLGKWRTEHLSWSGLTTYMHLAISFSALGYAMFT